MSFTGAFLVLGAIGCATFIYKRLTSKKTDPTGGPCDNSDAKPAICPPGKGNPLFTGVRVLELCEVIATPTCCRMFADMGADVIKVERPGRGDLLRTLLSKEFERDRPFGSPFDACNTSKRGIVLDIKKTEDLHKFKALLKDADVFVTNTRYHALESVGLTYEQIKDEFPGLVYAHLSAYGTTGPQALDPGFDTTSFWVGTGLSNAIQKEGMYSFYPGGFGDTVTGAILFSGICTALREKFETGIGMKVDTSLFSTGLFCQSATLCKEPAPERKAPIYQNVTSRVSPMRGSYKCKDYRYLHIGPVVSERESAQAKIGEIIPEALGKSGEELYDAVANKLKHMDVQDAVKMICDAGVDCVAHNHDSLFPVIGLRDNDRYATAKGYVKSFATDVPVIPNLPFDCHCSDKHSARSRAPYMGQHTQEVLTSGWFPRDDASALKSTTDSSAKVAGMPLDGITVIEWSDDGVAASTATMFAADLGATVIKIEPKEGDIWRRVNPEFFETMNRGKQSTITEDIYSILPKADVFVTNRTMSELKAKGLDPANISSKFPNLIYGLATPRGKDGAEDVRSDYLIWYGELGMSNCMAPAPPGFQPQLGNILTGSYLWAAIAAALFHRKRTGEGQLVETNHYRSAAFGVVLPSSLFLRTPAFEDFASTDPRDVDIARYFLALATFQCYKTKDGRWINLIGPDLAKDVPRLISALKVWPSVLFGLFPFIYRFATTKGTIFKKLRNLGKYLIPIIENKIAKCSYDDITKLFKEKNIWYCDVGVADQMTYNPQVKYLNLLAQAENGTNRIVRCPLSVGGLEKHSLSAPALPQSPSPMLARM